MFQFLQKIITHLFGFIVVIVLLAVIGRIFFFQIVRTDSYSMVPTLVAGDIFLVLTRGELKPGHIAVCQNPDDSGAMVVGRVVAKEGSTVAVEKNSLRLNGHKIEHQFTGKRMYVDRSSGEDLKYLVSLADEYIGGHTITVAYMERAGDKNLRETEVEDGLFLLGDNRNMARDSRHFGEVVAEDCIGKALVLVWPGEDSGDFKRKTRFLEWLF